MNIVDIIKTNTRLRLEALGCSAYAASIGSGHAAPWLTGIINGERYTAKIGSDLLEEIAAALGIPHHELVREGADLSTRKFRRPDWAKKKSTGTEK
jgi:hypothetical protein